MQYSYDMTANSFGKAFAHVKKLFVDEESTWHKSNRGIEQKHWRILYENDAKRRIQQALSTI